MKTKKKITMYLHILDGQLASYEGPGGQICYMGQGKPLKYAASLEQIRREQRASQEWRISQGFKPYEPREMGYLRTWLPSDSTTEHMK